ncbi:carboxylesterase/lipase family protein [Aquabacterium sp. OR-4]|uniref:carboxylesterase/lipase family protein n=1 Tax=Aquabacterium sp. OR-4 TaxID=2978127 RepID=UPI0028C80C13|nr:carboxylesterase family protein [Aquabacterium sp. OR-4]MDT7838580.1 carboxylesterase family protein [Aquabacterium sp. OR-4]
MTRAGDVEGLRLGEVEAFLGIPYAAAPVGPLRWRPPAPVAPWTGVRAATQYGPSAWQAVMPEGFGPWTREYVVQDEVSEDCLYLNVWTPATRAAGPCPVLVWIHGGAFCQGSGSVPIYEGRALAAQGVVVVTLNYRLGVLGFLSHPALSQEDPAQGGGNFGLQDQLAALRWIQDNIAAFGGNPGAVTLAGQSAGALSVHMLVASPRARGLFHRAIAQSGPPTLAPIRNRAEAEADGCAFVDSLQAATPDALRSWPVAALTRTLAPGPRFMPMVDGVLLPAWPPQRSPQHLGSDVPMLVGQTADENSGLDPAYAGDDGTALDALLQRQAGSAAPALAEAYRQACAGDTGAAYHAASRDAWLAALWDWASQRLGHTHSPVYAYHFDHAPPGPETQRYGAFHTAEVPYVMSTLHAAPDRGYSSDDHALSALASRYWLNFVRTGNPNSPGMPPWPALDDRVPRMLRIAPDPTVEPMLSAACRQIVDHQQRAPTLVTLLS